MLRVFNDAARREIIFEGKIDLEYHRRYRPFDFNPKYGQQEVLGIAVHGLQKDVDPETWVEFFLDEKPAELIRRPQRQDPTEILKQKLAARRK